MMVIIMMMIMEVVMLIMMMHHQYYSIEAMIMMTMRSTGEIRCWHKIIRIVDNDDCDDGNVDYGANIKDDGDDDNAKQSGVGTK